MSHPIIPKKCHFYLSCYPNQLTTKLFMFLFLLDTSFIIIIIIIIIIILFYHNNIFVFII